MKKRYVAANWEKFAPLELLQLSYTGHDDPNGLGLYRQRSVDALAERVDEVFEMVKRPVKLLDVACFTGDYFGRLAAASGTNARLLYTGIDVTLPYVAAAAERWRDFPNARFLCGSAAKLPFAASEFDIVFNSGLLIHINWVPACIAELARVARYYLLIETTVRPQQRRNFVEENKSGPNFIDRVYRPKYIRSHIRKYGKIKRQVSVPFYRDSESILFEVALNNARRR